jgi:hypothetical protein
MREVLILVSRTGIPFREWFYMVNVSFLYNFPFKRATAGLDQFDGRGSNGGVWEWTTTIFDNHQDLVPTQLFTG